jgi:WhiB family redox-sensing transcriptional regulator
VGLSKDWRRQAHCLGIKTAIFFPEFAQSDRAWQNARRICSRCPVRDECLRFALQWDELEDRWGMFAGLTPNERNLVRSQRRKNY